MQKFRILQCFSCNIFQVDIVKVATKWKCKICNEKQSVKNVYFESRAAKECREKVQEMNANFLRTKNYKAQLNLQQNQQVNNEPIPIGTSATTSYSNAAQSSKWNKFEQSEHTEAEPFESNINKRMNAQMNKNQEDSGLIVKKSKWSDFIDDEEEELDLSQLNEIDKPS
ncbi:unnamed protein product [Diamesa tonsa]